MAESSFSAARDLDLDLSMAQAVGESLHDVSDRETMDIMNLMRYPDYDSYTIGHSVRVAALSAMLAQELGWPAEIQAELATAQGDGHEDTTRGHRGQGRLGQGNDDPPEDGVLAATVDPGGVAQFLGDHPDEVGRSCHGPPDTGATLR